MVVPFPTQPSNSLISRPPSTKPLLTSQQRQRVRDMIDHMQRAVLDNPQTVMWLVEFNIQVLIRHLDT